MRRHARGFSMLEVISAILLLAVAFAALLHVAGSSLRLADQSGQISRADMWAQAKLDSLGIAEPLAVGDSAGSFAQDYRWHLRVVPWQDEHPPVDSPLALYQVDLDVEWGSKRRPHTLRYSTLRAVEHAGPPTGSAR